MNEGMRAEAGTASSAAASKKRDVSLQSWQTVTGTRPTKRVCRAWNISLAKRQCPFLHMSSSDFPFLSTKAMSGDFFLPIGEGCKTPEAIHLDALRNLSARPARLALMKRLPDPNAECKANTNVHFGLHAMSAWPLITTKLTYHTLHCVIGISGFCFYHPAMCHS